MHLKKLNTLDIDYAKFNKLHLKKGFIVFFCIGLFVKKTNRHYILLLFIKKSVLTETCFYKNTIIHTVQVHVFTIYIKELILMWMRSVALVDSVYNVLE